MPQTIELDTMEQEYWLLRSLKINCFPFSLLALDHSKTIALFGLLMELKCAHHGNITLDSKPSDIISSKIYGFNQEEIDFLTIAYKEIKKEKINKKSNEKLFDLHNSPFPYVCTVISRASHLAYWIANGATILDTNNTSFKKDDSNYLEKYFKKEFSIPYASIFISSKNLKKLGIKNIEGVYLRSYVTENKDIGLDATFLKRNAYNKVQKMMLILSEKEYQKECSDSKRKVIDSLNPILQICQNIYINNFKAVKETMLPTKEIKQLDERRVLTLI